MGILIRYLLRKPLLVHLLLIFIVVVALASLTQVRRVGLPPVDMGEVWVMTVYPGASPEDVELNVTRKLEESLEEVEGIDYFESESMENLSSIQIHLDQRLSDFEETNDEIRRAVEKVGDLPSEVTDDPEVIVMDTADMTIYEVALAGDMDLSQIKPYADRLKDALLELPDVSRVEEKGVPSSEIQILLNKEALNEHFISFGEVIDAIRANKIRLSGGSLESYTSSVGIVTLSDFRTIDDIERIIIRSNDAGQAIRLKDVAEVKAGIEAMDKSVRINGKPGMYLGVAAREGSDILDVVESVVRRVEQFRTDENLPAGLALTSLRDESIETKIRLNIVLQNAVAGFVLVMAVLFFFFNRRIAFWTAAGIPIAIAVALIGIPFLDITINRISLLGLIVVLGMLVDDSIIIAESIYTEMQSGKPPEEAAASGLSKVIRPVISTVITTVFAFVPMYFLGGPVGDFSMEIPTVVILMLVGSLLEALFILPVHLGHAGMPEGGLVEPPGAKLIAGLERRYSRLLQYCLVRRGFIAGSMLTGLVLALGLGILVVRFEMFPVDQAWRMWIYGKTRQDSNLEATERQAMRVESIVQSLPAGVIKSFTTTTGIKWDGTQVLPNLFLMELILSPSTERSMSAEEIKVFAFSRIREQKIPFDMDYYIDGGGPPAGKPIEIQVIGNENTQRLALLDQIQKDLESLGATNVDSNYTAGKPEIRLEPIHERIAQARLSVAQVATAIRTAFDGTVAAYLDTDEERIPFRVMLAEQSKDFENPLRGIKVMNSTGALIPVERVVRMHRVSSPQTIFHYNGHRSNQVTANIDRQKTTTSAFYAKLQGRYDPLMRENRGFRIELGGEGKESANTFSEMIIAIIVAVIGIYFILTVQFDSFLQPSMVLLAIPFGLAGILLAFALHGLGLSMLALVGILGFAGVVVNDSLVMVDQINQIRSNRLNSAESFHEEIIEGARNRLRPIVLTTLTTVAGLIPTAYGWFGGFDSFLSPLVMAMAWGLIVGTPATLFVIPVLYSLLHDLERRWRREGQ